MDKKIIDSSLVFYILISLGFLMAVSAVVIVAYPFYKSQAIASFDEFSYVSFMTSGVVEFKLILLAVTGLIAFIIPFGKYRKEVWKEQWFFKIPVEVGVVAILVAISYASHVSGGFWLLSGSSQEMIQSQYALSDGVASLLAILWHGAGLFLNFLLIWCGGICLKPWKENKIKEYFAHRSLVYHGILFFKKKIFVVYDEISHYDLSLKARRMILKIVLTNSVILFIISSLDMGGFMITIIYSIILYFILKKYISGIQTKYGLLLSKINQISSGDLNVRFPEDLGVFEPFKLQLLRIQLGFKNAVEAEMKSSNMKAELITNVSHDLKTPLTAIITYVDLLKDENITQEQRKEYLATLESKSIRLKVLIEDLFEVSKAATGNLILSPTQVDICSLLKQVVLEFADKLESARLDVRMNLPDTKIITWLDSQRTYRIYENLINNIIKYSMPGTRVFIHVINQGANVLIELKNISATELLVQPKDLTERFVRGDSSRNTEGSGLGLAIAKSLTELQKGHMHIEIDGDLFKAVTVFPIQQ